MAAMLISIAVVAMAVFALSSLLFLSCSVPLSLVLCQLLLKVVKTIHLRDVHLVRLRAVPKGRKVEVSLGRDRSRF